MKWHRYGNAANADENNSQNQCGILFPVQEEVSATEADLITRIKTTGKEKNYELIEYLNDVNREHAEVLVEQNINGRTDTSYIYGAEINGGFDRISLDRFDGSTGYYLYDARGSVSGITNEEGQVYQSYRYSVTGEITFGAPQYENEYTYNGESYNPNIESQYLRARYYCVVTATFLTEDSYLGSLTEPLTLNRYNYCVSSYLNYTDPSGNEVEVLESLKGWIIDPNTQAQKTIENYENQRLSIEDAIESGLLNNRAGQIFLDYGDIVMGPAVKTPADIIVIRETVKGNSDSKEMQRTATAGFYAGFVGQGIEYTQIISKADYQLSMIITSAKGVNSINNPLSYLLFIKDFSLTQTLDAAKAGLQDAWNGTYDSAIGRKIGAGTFNYLLMTIGGAQLKGKGNACEAVESGSNSKNPMTGDDWHKYFNEKYGAENVTWESASIQDIIDMPSKITDFSPKQISDLARRSGWTVGPLGKGSLAGITYEQGGGISMHAPNGSSIYIQYHPGGGHHGVMPYYKVSSGKNGTVRYYINGERAQ